MPQCFGTTHTEAGEPPPMELVQKMGQFIGEHALELSGMAEAIDLCQRYAAILGGTLEIDIRPLAEPEAA